VERSQAGTADDVLRISAEFPDGYEPLYASCGAAGADLKAFISEPVRIRPGEHTQIPTGVRIAIPEGFEGQVRPRSGLAARFGVTVLNSPGTVDSDYRGEIRVILINHGPDPFDLNPGDRIAQLVISRVTRATFILDSLSKTQRGDGGFGSTGR
jgi:dUTP pyrophosphatase